LSNEFEDNIQQTSERIVCENELDSIFSKRKNSDSPGYDNKKSIVHNNINYIERC